MDTTIFQKFYEEKTALINPTDCIKPIDNFPEVCISTFSKNIIDKFILLESGRIDHSESDRNSQFELNRNSQCTLAN